MLAFLSVIPLQNPLRKPERHAVRANNVLWRGGVGGIAVSAQCSHLLNRVLILKLQISLFGSLQIKTKM